MIAADHDFAERILSLVPINNLDARLQQQALAQGELLEFRKKKTVFEIGARDPYTFYLLDGELELQASESSPVRMSAGDENARRALAQLQPRRYTAVAITPVSIFRIERAVLEHILADEQVLEESAAEMDVRELEDEDEEDGSDWMSRLLSSELFTRLPHENIQRFFTSLEPLEAEKDEVIVEQGTSGDYLYIVAEGRCTVVRRAPGGGQETQLAVLKEGDTFGEEALISNSPRNASVRMASDGMLMRLPKEDFEELVSNPTLKAVPWSEASKLANDGALWVDVRFADEYQTDGIEGALNAPLNTLRQQVSTFNQDKQYIVYCDSGARSSAGAFLMARLGFETCYLAGGLERSPRGSKTAAASAESRITSEADDIASTAGAATFNFEFTSDDAPAKESAAHAAPAPVDSSQDATPAPSAQTNDVPPAAAPAPTTDDSAASATVQMAKARAALATLQAERDKAAAYAQKAADAARELKRRNDQLNKVVQDERERREQLDKQLAATKADSDRQASMEQTRLNDELAKASKRIEALQLEHEQAQQKIAAERTQVRSQIENSENRLKAALKEKQQADSILAAEKATFQEALESAQSEAKTAQGAVADIEKELALAREQIAEIEEHDRKQAEELLTETSRLKLSMTQDQIRVEKERERLEQEREQLNNDLQQSRKDREAADALIREERVALEKQIADVRARDETLHQREIDLSNAISEIDKDAQQRLETLTEREKSISEDEQALSDEKARWQETVDKAISDERQRLQSEHTRFREETDELIEARVQTLLEEKTQELVAGHDEHETQMRRQVEAHVAKLLAEFDVRLETMRSGYETKLSEQEAMLEDERRRLEAEIVRLRAALTDARTAPSAHRTEAAAQTPLPIRQATAPGVAAGAPDQAPDQAPDLALDLALDLEIDEADLHPREHSEDEAQVARASDLPVLEIPTAADPAPSHRHRANEKHDRVISANQLADIRARMQEKMRAAKSRAS